MRILLPLCILGACAAEREPERNATAGAPAAAPIPRGTQSVPRQSSMLTAIPEDPAALEKLTAMGYTVHDDHLHQPGVESCPKMTDGPVQ